MKFVPTYNHLADILTKPLSEILSSLNTKKLEVWYVMELNEFDGPTSLSNEDSESLTMLFIDLLHLMGYKAGTLLLIGNFFLFPYSLFLGNLLPYSFVSLH